MRKITYTSESGEKFVIEYIMVDGRPKSVNEFKAPDITVGQILRRAYKPIYQAKQAEMRGSTYTKSKANDYGILGTGNI